jgi:hypothetical protein
MEKKFFYVILFFLSMIFSCRQDPIFYSIFTEPLPKEARIPGCPTNMAVFERESGGEKIPIMYVASGGLHWYAKETEKTGEVVSKWDSDTYKIHQPDGKVIGLAVTNEHLYALCIDSGVTTKLWRIGSAVNIWENVPIEAGISYTLIQSIFADKDTGRLFAGAMNSGGDYGILYLAEDASTGPVMRLIISDSELLSGAASRNNVHYLCTRGKGVYCVLETALSADTEADFQLRDLDNVDNKDKKNRLFMGMIKLNDAAGTIIAVERNGGAFFVVLESGFRQLKYSNGDIVATGKYATGALALWRQVIFSENEPPRSGEDRILAVGIQGGLYTTVTTSSYTHGYLEFGLNTDGSLDLTATRRDNSPTITVNENTDRYTATIGKHPINHMFQMPDSIEVNMTFFASTQTAGLWSYRNRVDGWQWNAED